MVLDLQKKDIKNGALSSVFKENLIKIMGNEGWSFKASSYAHPQIHYFYR